MAADHEDYTVVARLREHVFGQHNYPAIAYRPQYDLV